MTDQMPTRFAEVFREFVHSIIELGSISDVLWCAADCIGKLGFEDCVIYRADFETGKLTQESAFGEKVLSGRFIKNRLEIPIGHGVTGHAFMTQKSLIVDDITKEPRYIADLGVAASEITVPIILDGQVFGVIDCERAKIEAFDDQDLLALETIVSLMIPKLQFLKFKSEQSVSKSKVIAHNKRLKFELDKTTLAHQSNFHAQTMEKVGQLSGGIAHDFNNHLAVMRSGVEVLLLENPEIEEELRVLENAINRSSELTQSLLAFSSQQVLFPDCVNLTETVTEMQSFFERSLGVWVRIKTKIDDDLWNVNLDLGQLENALLNLTINARDAMPQGGDVTISCYNTDLNTESLPKGLRLKAGPYVVVSVSDTGEGMSDAVLSRAFEPYFTTKGPGKGSGLGLSMVFGFVRQSGGDVLITSMPNEGTSVKLFFPRANTPACVVPATTSRMDLVEGNGRKILVIEDDHYFIVTLGKLLKLLGFEPILANTPEEARQLAQAHTHLDLILSDVILGNGIYGPDICTELLEAHPHVTCIFMSGFVDLDRRISFGKNAVKPFLSKPFTLKDLSNVLEESLQEQQVSLPTGT